MSDDGEVLESTAMQVVAGGVTAVVEVCLMQPLDVVRTRLQLQSARPPAVATVPGNVQQHYYTGVVNCIRTANRHEGFPALWKGVVPSLLVETPRRALNFLLFDQYKQYLLFGSAAATPLTYYTAGLCVGISEAVLINPFELVKVTLQSDRTPSGKAPSTWSVAKEILRRKGFGLHGLNRGLSATVISHGIFNTVYFGVFHSLKGRLRPFSNQTLYLYHIMAIGFAAGVLASLANNPFDVAKTRIQGPQPEAGIVKYRSPLATVATVFREEGWRVLFKGSLPKVLRHGFGGAIMVAVYDYTYKYLTNGFTE